MGIREFAAIINPPEGAILAVGAVRKEPVVRGDQIVVGHRMSMTLSCDHRVIDGALGAKVLQAIVGILEKPISLAF
jgi:pyruvate dehydrogenase E2 component (dihydrolipoamide acetyltransferase)